MLARDYNLVWVGLEVVKVRGLSSVVHWSIFRMDVLATVVSVVCVVVLPFDVMSGTLCAWRSRVAKAAGGNTLLSRLLVTDVRATLLVVSMDME